ncbi:MAG: hypothetical protein Q4C47_03170, partial [Planctomycetia bacterium]|nr:hypothetical protein [Planctomycetia bacterium]
VSMNFGPEAMRELDGFRCGTYEPMNPGLLPPMYLAYGLEIPKSVQIGTRSLIERYREGNTEVLAAVEGLKQCTVEAREAILSGDVSRFGQMIDEGFRWRRRVIPIREEYLRMVEMAHASGLSAGFTGSGGAIIGVCPDDETFRKFSKAMESLHCRVIRPIITDQTTIGTDRT